MNTSNVLADVLEVFSSMIEWVASAIQPITAMFWTAESGLTFLGVLATAGLAISIVFLLIGVLSNFLHFRG